MPFLTVKDSTSTVILHREKLLIQTSTRLVISQLILTVNVLLISEADQRSSAYLMENHHGLSILMGDGENLPADMLKLEIEKCYRRTRSVFRVAVKSKEADEYLASCGIPTINLLIYGATHKNIDDGSVHPCSLHCKDICAKPRCALANVHLMRKWVESKRKLI